VHQHSFPCIALLSILESCSDKKCFGNNKKHLMKIPVCMKSSTSFLELLEGRSHLALAQMGDTESPYMSRKV
jgi:hypothetical protein